MDYQDTIYNAIDKYSARIESAENAEDIPQLFDEAWSDFENLWLEGSKLPGNETACEAGCVYCCHYTVSLRAHEVAQVLEHILKNFTKAEIKEVVKRAKQNRTRMKKLTHEQIEHTNIKCPLLSDEGLCRCYEVRPLNCRRNNSRDIDLCRAFHENPESDLMADSAKDIDHLTSTIGYALNEAFSQNGYDDSIYYLNHALYEGLLRPRTITRWHKKKKAFSRAAESKEFD
ncbi:YkgJ family cysteine cluster protein [Verrucomicrobiota bacterium]